MPDVGSAQYPTGGLLGLLNAYDNGANLRRSRAQQSAEAQQKADEFISQHAPEKQVKLDEFGFPTGLQTDQGERAQALKYLKSSRPDLFPQEAPSQSPAAQSPLAKEMLPKIYPDQAPAALGQTQQDTAGLQQEASQAMTPEGTAARNADRDRLMGLGKPETGPGDPSPLIRDPKASLHVADALVQRPDLASPAPQTATPGAGGTVKGPGGETVKMPQGATSMTYDPNDPKVTQNGQTFVPARSTAIPASGDVSVQGQATPAQAPVAPQAAQRQAPAAPAPAASAEPTDYQLKRLSDLATMLPRAGQFGKLVDVNDLSPMEAAAIGGVSQDMLDRHVKIPTALIEQAMKGATAKDVQGMKNQGATVDPKFQPVLDAVQAKEITPGAGLAMAARLNGGQPAPHAVVDAINKATEQGNKDRSFGLANDKFEQQKGKQAADVIKGATTAATGLVKNELDGWDASINVQNMLRQKNTAGLEAKINMMLVRAIAKARVTNMELSSMDGLTGAENKLDQWLTKVQGEGLTNENKALGLFIAQSLQNEYEGAVKSRVSWVANSAKRQLMAQGMNPDAAETMVNESLDPAKLISFSGFGAKGGGAGGSPATSSGGTIPTTGTTAYPGAQAAAPNPGEFKKNPPTKEEINLRDEMAKTTSYLRRAGADKAAQDRIKAVFKSRTGIDWDSAGGGQ